MLMFTFVFGLILMVSVLLIFIVKLVSINSHKSYDTLVDKKKVYLHVYDSRQRRCDTNDNIRDYKYTVRFNKSYDSTLNLFDKDNLYSFSSRFRYSIFGVDKGYVCEAYECTYNNSKGQSIVLYDICVPDNIKGVKFEKAKSSLLDFILSIFIVVFAVLFFVLGYLL